MTVGLRPRFARLTAGYSTRCCADRNRADPSRFAHLDDTERALRPIEEPKKEEPRERGRTDRS